MYLLRLLICGSATVRVLKSYLVDVATRVLAPPDVLASSRSRKSLTGREPAWDSRTIRRVAVSVVQH